MTPEPQWEELGRQIRARRRSLSLTQHDVHERGGPSDTTLGKLESATSTGWSWARMGKTLTKVDTGLDWKPGSAVAILNGGTPTPLDSTPDEGPIDPELQAMHAIAATLDRLDSSARARVARWALDRFTTAPAPSTN